MEKLEEKIKKLALEQGISITKVVETLGMTQNGYYKMLKNNSIKGKNLEKLSQLFEVPVSYFIVEGNISSKETEESVSIPKKLYDFMMSEFDRYRKREDERNQILSKLDKLEKLGKCRGVTFSSDSLHFPKVVVSPN